MSEAAAAANVQRGFATLQIPDDTYHGRHEIRDLSTYITYMRASL